MKGKFSLPAISIFVFGYAFSEWIIQPNLHLPTFLRHHLSDFFAGPSFLAIAVLGFNINNQFLKYYGHFISFSICLTYEMFFQKTDYIDIFAYILGLVTYIFLTLKLNDEQIL
jgi:hypothetical protein